MDVWMHKSEIELIEKYLKPEYTMLEWGGGGSTLHFSKLVSKYYSIEHDTTWYNNLKKEIPSNVKLYNIPLDIELTFPTIKECVNTYVEHISSLDVKRFDAILIDGRGRGWCAEKALDYIDKESIVFMHDYCLRPNYHIVEQWYTVIESICNTPQTIVALRKK